MNKGKFFSAALYKENLKRFWPLAAMGFFIYFMSGPFIVLRSIGMKGYSRIFLGYTGVADGFMAMLLSNRNAGFEFVHLVLPVAAAVAVFSYLNKTGSVGVVHSMPFSRRMLFITNCASGLTLSFAPFFINWVFTFLLKGKVNAAAVDVSYGAFFTWLLSGLAIIAFVFSLAALACVVSGNGVIATLTGFAFNFLIQAVILCFAGYAVKFLTGYNGDGIWDLIMYISPWTRTFYDLGITALDYLLYLVIAVVILVVCDILYHKRALERCGDSYVFSWMQTIVGFLFVFVITTLTGLVLFDGLGIMAYVIGFIIGFLLGQMISQKTLHIFNKTGLRNLIVFAVIMALIIAGFAIDIIGFQKMVPDAGRVKSVDVNSNFFLRYETKTVTQEDAIKAVVGLHKEIVSDLDALREAEEAEESSYSYGYDYGYSSRYTMESVSITYTLNNGRKIYRSYYVPASLLDGSASYQALRSAPEVQSDVRSLTRITAKNRYVTVQYMLPEMTSTAGTENPDEPVKTGFQSQRLELTASELNKLLEAYDADAKKLSSSTARYFTSVYELELYYVFDQSDDNGLAARLSGYPGFAGMSYGMDGENTVTASFFLSVGKEFSQTIAFLTGKGFPGPERLVQM